MKKVSYFYIDDVIWLFRDLTREKPKSIFDNAFMKMLKEAHDKYGLKVQLNVFYRTDFFYGDDEFTLDEMTDAYKQEWTDNSDWIKFGFHSKEEWPDYPYVNADYDTVKKNLDRTKANVFRFAGEKSFALGTVPHWLPISKDGVKALYDGGIKILNCSRGDILEELEPFDVLHHCEAFRVIYNRKPETKLYKRFNPHNPDDIALCAYNHLSQADHDRLRFTTDYIVDKETGMCFKPFTNAPGINASSMEEIIDGLNTIMGEEYIGYGTHEQYFYSDYFNHQPDYPAKLLMAAKMLHENGYEFIFIEDLVK